MVDYILGMNAKIYQGTAAAAIGTLTLMDNVRDVTLNLDAGEADVTTRANSGWRATAASLWTATVDFEMIWEAADAGFTAVRTAYLAGTTLELAVLDQLRETSGAQGLKGSFSITNFSRGEPLEEAIVVSVTAKLVTFDEWVVVA